MVSIAELLSAKQKLREAEKQYKKRDKRVMHKEYLSRDDRESLMVLAAVASKLEDFIHEWLKHGIDRSRIKYAKTALTYIYKSMDTYFDGLSEAEKRQQVYRILKDLKQCNIYLERGGIR